MRMRRPASVRHRRSGRLDKQYRLLNRLRLIFFLHPSKLGQIEGFGDPKILNVLDSIGVESGGTGEEEVVAGIIGRQQFFQLLTESSASIKERASLEAEFMKRWEHHFYRTYALATDQRGTNPKAINLEPFIKKVVTFHAFELNKTFNDRTSHSHRSYSDYLKTALSTHTLGISKPSADRYIRQAKLREEQDVSQPRQSDDKRLAKMLYRSTSKQALNRVRQDRKRLKKYRLL